MSLLLLGTAACVSSFGNEPDPFEQEAFSSYPDQEILGDEEVLTDEEDEFGRPNPGATGHAGGVLVAVGYVGAIVAAVVLPLLAL